MDRFTKEELWRGLRTNALGRNAVLLDTIDSTNLEARRKLDTNLPHGAVFIAGRQTGGRGRRGRHWVSEPGCGLWMTVVLKPFMALEEMQKLTLLIGLAVCQAVVNLTAGALKPAIKWPNDVLAGGRKLCGILCESAADSAGQRMVIAGIGVNTRTPSAGYGEAAPIAISVEEASGQPVGRLRLAAEILNQMELLLDGWQADGFTSVAAGYREYMVPAGTPVEIIDGERRRLGHIDALDDGGALLVRLQNGVVERVISGEISIRSVGDHV